MGSKDQNSTFSENGHFANQIKENHKCSKIVANILPVTALTLGMGLIGKNSFFSDHGHVAYQLKGNRKIKQHGSKYFALRPNYPPQL